MSIVPPCTAESTWTSPPSTPPGNSFTCILPPLFCATRSANFWPPCVTGWPVGFCVVHRNVCSRTCAVAAPAASSVPQASAAIHFVDDFIVVSSLSWQMHDDTAAGARHRRAPPEPRSTAEPLRRSRDQDREEDQQRKHDQLRDHEWPHALDDVVHLDL